MPRGIPAAFACAALTLMAMPAHAAWKTYVSKDLGFFFAAPGEVKAELGTFRGASAGPRQTIVFKSEEDDIEYKVTVISLMQAKAEGATVLGEREYMFQDKKKVLADGFARAGSGKDIVYGRKMAVELPDNKGRTTGVFYFTKGRLVSLEATMLPTHKGDAPDIDRFLGSVEFVPSHAGKDAVLLPTPKLE